MTFINNNESKKFLETRLAEITPARCPGMQPFKISKINRTGKKKQLTKATRKNDN